VSTLEIIRASLADWLSPVTDGAGLVLPIPSAFPSGAMLYLRISVEKNTIVVSDNGATVEELSRACDVSDSAIHQLSRLAKSFGLVSDSRGWLSTKPAPQSHLELQVTLVAEATKSILERLQKLIHAEAKQDYRPALLKDLQLQFGERLSQRVRMPGLERSHMFDAVVQLRKDRQLVLDFVQPDANSINAAVVAHLDLKSLQNKEIMQAIVYNSNDNWPSHDLAILQFGAPPVQASALAGFINGIAA
jgi:transposase-like protein